MIRCGLRGVLPALVIVCASLTRVDASGSGQQSQFPATGAAGQGTWSTQAGPILERCGRTGAFTVGEKLSDRARFSLGRPLSTSEYPTRERRAPFVTETVYASADRGTIIEVAADRTIVAIVVNRRGVFTQRYAVIGESTMADVIVRYGRGTPVQRSSSEFLLFYPYEGVVFGFKPTANLDNLTNARLDSVKLKFKDPDPSGKDHSCNVK